jgi:hypothetical protein
MTSDPLNFAFTAARRLPGYVAGALLAPAALLAGILLLSHDANWWRGYVAALLISALAATASLPPLMWGLRSGLTHAVGAYFLGAALRATISLGGCALAVTKGNYPRTATMLLMVAFYFAVLAAESITVARAIWSAKLTTLPGGSQA